MQQVGEDAAATVDAAELGAEERRHADDQEQVAAERAHALFQDGREVPHEARPVRNETDRMQDGERAKHEQEHGEAAEQPKEQGLVDHHVAEPVLEPAPVVRGVGVQVAGVQFLDLVLMHRAHQRWHTGTHSDVLLAQVVGVVEIAESAGAGEYHSAEETVEGQLIAHRAVLGEDVYGKVREAENADDAAPHLEEDVRRPDLPDDVDEPDDDDHDQSHDAAFHGGVDHLGAEQDGRYQCEHDRRPEPRRTVVLRSEDEIAQRDAGFARPSGQELADENHEDEQVHHELDDPGHAGEWTLAGGD